MFFSALVPYEDRSMFANTIDRVSLRFSLRGALARTLTKSSEGRMKKPFSLTISLRNTASQTADLAPRASPTCEAAAHRHRSRTQHHRETRLGPVHLSDSTQVFTAFLFSFFLHDPYFFPAAPIHVPGSSRRDDPRRGDPSSKPCARARPPGQWAPASGPAGLRSFAHAQAPPCHRQ